MTEGAKEREPEIDWSRMDGMPDNTVTCGCGYVYRSHVKVVEHEGRMVVRSRRRCPACGANNRVRQASSDPESFTL
jgi:uncharacterized protein (DUF983 family)